MSGALRVSAPIDQCGPSCREHYLCRLPTHELNTQLEFVRPAVLRFAKRFSASFDDAEDLVQEAMIRVYTRRRYYDPGRMSLINWSRLMLVQHIADWVRDRARPIHTVNVNLSYDQGIVEEYFTSPDFSSDVLSRNVVSRFVEKIAQRSEEHLAVLGLLLQGYICVEVADILGKSEGSVWKMRSRMRMVMDKLIEDDRAEDDRVAAVSTVYRTAPSNYCLDGG